MPKGRPKKTPSTQIDIGDLSDLQPLREQLEGGLQQLNACGPEHSAHLTALQPQLTAQAVQLRDRCKAAETRVTQAAQAQFKPLLDLLDACERMICSKLGLPEPVKAAEEISEHTYAFEVVDISIVPDAFKHGFDHGLANRFCEHKSGDCLIPGVVITKRGG